MGLLRRHRGPFVILMFAGTLVGCPRKWDITSTQVVGSVVDEAGNAVRPTRVDISLEGGEPAECSTRFGAFYCNALGTGVHTVHVERGAEVYTDSVFVEDDGCRDGCALSLSFTVASAADGPCSADTLPLVARLVSPTPPQVGGVIGVWHPPVEGLNFATLPADPISSADGSEARGLNEWSLYAEPNLPLDTTLVLDVTLGANEEWCADHGPWSRSMPLRGVARVEFQPRPGASPCEYDPVELSVGPDDLLDCYK